MTSILLIEIDFWWVMWPLLLKFMWSTHLVVEYFCTNPITEHLWLWDTNPAPVWCETVWIFHILQAQNAHFPVELCLRIQLLIPTVLFCGRQILKTCTECKLMQFIVLPLGAKHFERTSSPGSQHENLATQTWPFLCPHSFSLNSL